MQSDANNPMEKWLSSMAQKRQEESPSSWEMPDQMRQTLLHEVEKTYSSHFTPASARLINWLTTWRRLIWAGGLATVFLLFFWLIKPDPPMELAKSMSPSLLEQKKSHTGQDMPIASGRKLMEKQAPEMGVPPVASVSDTAPSATARDRSISTASPKSTLRMEASAPKESFQGAITMKELAPEIVNAPQPSASKPIAPASQPISMSKDTLERYALKAPPKTALASMPSNDIRNPTDKLSSTSNVMMFAKIAPAVLETARAARAPNGSLSSKKSDFQLNSSAIFNRFSVERRDNQIFFIDEDGSKYIGKQWVTNISTQIRSRISSPAPKSSKTYGVSGAATQMGGVSQTVIVPDKSAKQTWFFHAIGTNLTTMQPVILEGSFVEDRFDSQNYASYVRTDSVQKTNTPSNIQEYLRIKVQVQIDSTNYLSFEAKQIAQ